MSLDQRRLPTIDTFRFDLLRGFSGAEKLAFPPNVHDFVATSAASTLTSLVGCPVEVFVAISETLVAGKEYRAGSLGKAMFQTSLDSTLLRLQDWDPNTGLYPNQDHEWVHLAEAYRHMAILRVLRFPDPYDMPCTDPSICASVAAILDASTRVPRRSQYFKRLLFPLFIAAAETESPHQQQYVVMCVEHISEMTGITYHSINELLEKTWQKRRTPNGDRNVPWHDFVRTANNILRTLLTMSRHAPLTYIRGNTIICSSENMYNNP